MVRRGGAESLAAFEALFTIYRRPFLSYLQSAGHQPADAEELLNGFYAALLRRDFLRYVAATKGSFRTVLLRLLARYREDEANKSSAGKSGGELSRVPVGQPGEADKAFDREWGLAVLREALRRLHEDYRRHGNAALCHALEPILLQDPDAPTYDELSRRLDMEEQALRTATGRMRHEFGECVRAEIGETVDNPQDWEDECRHLLRIVEG